MYPSDATSKIVVFRKKGMAGVLIAYAVKINGVVQAKLMVNDSVPIPLPPGQYELQITAGVQGSKPLTFVIQPGQQIDFTCEAAIFGMLHPITLYRNDAPPPPTVSQKFSRFFSQPGQQQQGQGQFQQPQSPSAGPVGAAGMWQPPGATPQPQPQTPPQRGYPAAGPTGPIPEPQIIEYVETDQTEEPLGQEVRVIDNRQSGTGVTRSVKASREWTRNLTVGTEHSRTLGAEVGGKWHSWLALKGTIESELQRNYSMETSSKHLFEETITISAPPRTTIRLVLHWKRIWQNGVVRLSNYDGSISEVPYKFVVNITFDQSQQDTDSDPAQVV